MICKLGLALGCPGLTETGNCAIYFDEGIARRMETGSCAFMKIHMPSFGIHAGRMKIAQSNGNWNVLSYEAKSSRNPLKASKAAQRAQGASQA